VKWWKLHRAIQNKRCGIVLLHENVCLHTAAQLDLCWSISTGTCFTTLLTAVILLWATTTCLPTWRTGCYHSVSTIMMSWWKVSKRSWAHRRHISLTQAYKNLFPIATSASVPTMTPQRCSLSMYIFFVYNTFFFLIDFFYVNSSLQVTFQIALIHNKFFPKKEYDNNSTTT
jgi:hypothetical protein